MHIRSFSPLSHSDLLATFRTSLGVPARRAHQEPGTDGAGASPSTSSTSDSPDPAGAGASGSASPDVPAPSVAANGSADAAAAGAGSATGEARTPAAPLARKQPHVRSFHGRDVTDDYEWLREKDSAEVRAHLEAENAYTLHRTSHLEPLTEAIFQEVKARVQETDMSLPVRSGGWWYFSRSTEGKDYGAMCRIPVATGSDSATGEGTGQRPDGGWLSSEEWTPPTIDPEHPADGEEVFLDCNVEAEGHEFFSLGAASVTVDGTRLAYSTDYRGDERFTLRFRDLTTGEDLPDTIEDVHYGATWVGNDTVYYQRVDDAWRPHEVWRHRVGTPVEQDELIFREDDGRFWVGVGTTRSERYLVISTGSKVTSECWYLDLEADESGADQGGAVASEGSRVTTVHTQTDEIGADQGELRGSSCAHIPGLTCVLPREDNVEYGVNHARVAGEDYWLVLHNKNGVNGELGRHRVGPISSLDDLEQMVPAREDARIEGVDCYAGHVVLEMRENAVERIYVMTLRDEHGKDTGWGRFEPVQFREELSSVGAGGNSEWDAPVLRLVYTSFTTPTQVWDLDVATGRRVLRKEQQVLPAPDGTEFRPTDYVAERRWVTASDGQRIPVSLIHHRRVQLPSGDAAAAASSAPADTAESLPASDVGSAPASTGPHPVLLYGYGSYETSLDPGFSIFRLSLLDRGVVYAIAHVRGGGELGRAWYDTGKGLQKKNTFTDFIAVADDLIASGITTPSQMVAEGGSAGGLLMGAVANMAPDRFGGILAIVPFVDPLTSMLMPELPLTVTEWDEWGDAFHDVQVYDYMAEYAPYENISAGVSYPPILAITSLNDTRVLYVEPAKWVAKLRDVAGADALLKIDMEAGHGGVSGRYAKWRQSAFETAWALERMGAAELRYR